MKVLFILENTMDNLEGGTEVSSRHLAGLLRKQGVGVEEWAPFNARKQIFWYTSIFGQIYILIVLLWKLVKNRVQILHVQGKYLIPPVVILGKILKIPTVVTIRDYVIVCPIGLCLFKDLTFGFKKGVSLLKQGDSLINSTHGFIFFLFYEIPRFLSIYHRNDYLMIRIIRYVFQIRGWFMSRWLRFWLKRADGVVAVSKYVQGVLETHGIKSEVIYNAFDPVFAMEFNKVRPWIPKVGPLNTVVFVGKPSYGKGHDLFRSLSHSKVFDKYRFKTIGGSNKLPYLKTLQKIREATAVVIPSRWPEPFGRVALEALMLGTPVVATNQGGLPEIVKDDVTGVLADPTNESLVKALKAVIFKNNEFRKNIRRRKRALVSKFQEKPTEQHLEIYLKLIDDRCRLLK